MQPTTTGRAQALSWAHSARSERHRIRRDLSSGATTLSEVLVAATSDPFVAQVRLGWVLESLPGARKVDTRRALGRHGLDATMALSDLTDLERRTVLGEFGRPGERS